MQTIRYLEIEGFPKQEVSPEGEAVCPGCAELMWADQIELHFVAEHANVIVYMRAKVATLDGLKAMDVFNSYIGIRLATESTQNLLAMKASFRTARRQPQETGPRNGDL